MSFLHGSKLNNIQHMHILIATKSDGAKLQHLTRNSTAHNYNFFLSTLRRKKISGKNRKVMKGTHIHVRTREVSTAVAIMSCSESFLVTDPFNIFGCPKFKDFSKPGPQISTLQPLQLQWASLNLGASKFVWNIASEHIGTYTFTYPLTNFNLPKLYLRFISNIFAEDSKTSIYVIEALIAFEN